jgi:DNA ligase (NAD+)
MIKINKTLINNIIKDPISVLKSLKTDDIVVLIQKANQKYYNNDAPLFSDQIYDLIKEYLAEIIPNHPVLQNIGTSIDAKKKVCLPFFMGSLDKIKNDEKILMNWHKQYPGPYVISDKLDGNSGLLTYNSKTNELFLFTRGDGKEGQNISHILPFLNTKLNINTFQNISASLNCNIAIRGEIIISKAHYESIANKGANARNTVAGLLNSKIPDLQIAKLTSFVGYEVIEPIMSPLEQMKFIRDQIKMECVYSIDINNEDFNLNTLSNKLTERRKHSPYEIDGIVVVQNKIYSRVNGNPNHAFAFKSILTMDKAEVTVTKVEWNMSKDGIYIPVVHFTPVALDGVIITKAHGFNGKYIQDNSIGPGAIILVMRSGAVIPYIIETLIKADKPQMPDSSYIWNKSGVNIMINLNTSDNEISSNNLKYKNIAYFFDKIDVKGLSEGIITKIVNKGFNTVGQIFDISKEQLLTIDGFQDTLADKIHKALQERKKSIDAYLILDASNVMGRGIGYKKIKLICDVFPKILLERYIPLITELVAIKGIEKTTAEQFIQNLPKMFQFVDENNLSTIVASQTSQTNVSSSTEDERIKDKTFIFTGVRDKEVETFILKHGGIIGSNVSSKTHMLIVKSLDIDSSKTKKAKELNIKIMTLQDFKNELSI